METLTEQESVVIQSSAKPDLFDTDYLKDDLKGRSIRGGVITIFSQGCNFALKMVSTVVLARLLIPADFGLIAMVMALTNFAMMFKDLGLSMATIQKADINHAQISTLFWINVVVGIVIAIIVAVLAPVVAWFYGQPELKMVTIGLGISFIFGGLTIQHQALLRRHMRFFRLGVVEVVAMAVSIVAAIIAGICQAGYWSLVIMHITLAVATAIGTWIAIPWLPGLPKMNSGFGKMLGFGGNITGYNIVNYFARNADNILIGKFVGAAALGFYSKAYGLLMLPIGQIRSPLVSVGLPGLSRLQKEAPRYRSYYLKMLQMLAFISVPIVSFLGVHAEEIILVVLGPQWQQSAHIFVILAIAAIIQPLLGTEAMVMISWGNTGRYLKLGIFSSLVYVTSFCLGLPWGATGVALSYTIANYAILVPALSYAFNGTPINVKDFFKSIAIPCMAAAIMTLVSRLVFHLTSRFMGDFAIIIALLIGVLVYFAAYLVSPAGRAILKELKKNYKILFAPSESRH